VVVIYQTAQLLGALWRSINHNKRCGQRFQRVWEGPVGMNGKADRHVLPEQTPYASRPKFRLQPSTFQSVLTVDPTHPLPIVDSVPSPAVCTPAVLSGTTHGRANMSSLAQAEVRISGLK
jgi:hypothetical protein